MLLGTFIFLFLVLTVSPQYLEKTNKNVLFMNLCAGSNNPEVCVPLHFSYDVLKTFEADCSDLLWGGKCKATVLVSTIDYAIAIFFKGPPSMANFKKTATSKLAAMTLTDFGNGFGKVGTDYETAFDRLWNGQGMGTYMQQIWAQYCDFVLVTSGHSLGSCLAQMATIQVKEDNLWTPETIIYYGYGTPRCGDVDFAATMDSSANVRYRVHWLGDNIPQYPPTSCARTGVATYGGYQQCWFHCCKQVWMKSSFLGIMSWKTSDLPEDASANGGTNTNDHTAYWSTSQAQYESLTCGSSMTFKPDP